MTLAGAPMVFIIDDDADVRESIQDLLESSGLRSEAPRRRKSSWEASGGTGQVVWFWT